jgi:nucleotidyltransferase substrate binding protein (TIGR01987 family)
VTIDYSPLAKAIHQLETSLAYAASPMAEADPGLFEQLRNSVIQCFEFTYELSHKMLRRFLEETSATPAELDFGTFQNLIRTGNERGLLRSDWTRWRTYRQARNDSSPAYDERKAQMVYELAPDFLEEARFLYRQLTERSTPP